MLNLKDMLKKIDDERIFREQRDEAFNKEGN